jgi:hypothetical protein
MDILRLQEMANTMPTPALMEAVNNPNSPVPAYLALTVLNERKKATLGNNAQKAQAQLAGQQPTVAQEVTQGVAGLPTGGAIPQQYAAGGIVTFSKGGSGDEGEYQFPYPPRDPRNALQLMQNWAQGVPQRLNNWAQRVQMGITLDNPYSNEGRNYALPPAIAEQAARGVFHDPRIDQPDAIRSPAPAASGVAQLPQKQGAGAGVAALRAQSAPTASGYPDFVDPRTGATPRVTEEQRDAMVAAQYEKMKALYGPDAADAYLKQIQAEREAMKGRYKDNANEAWLRAGLGMLAGRSKWGAVNIGEGGQQGLNAYQQGRAAIDRDMRDLRREEMQAAAAAQARQDQIKGASIGAADRQADRGDRQRAEDIAVAGQQLAHKVGAAEFVLQQRKLDIEMTKARAEMARAVQAGELTKQDAAARLYQSAQVDALKIIKADIAAAEKNMTGRKSPYAAMTEEEQYAASQIMAKRWIENNQPLATIVDRGQAPATRKWPGQQ